MEKTENEMMAVDRIISSLDSKIVNANPEDLDKVATMPEWWSVTNAMTISASVLIFTLLVLGLATYLINKGHHQDVILKVFGMILIVGSAVFVLVAGYSDSQIAPAYGLLGTLAGYLLSKDGGGNSSDDSGTGPG